MSFEWTAVAPQEAGRTGAKPLISLVVPVYNEEAAIGAFLDRMRPILRGETEAWEILFVNDGSRDATLDIVRKASSSDARIRALDLSRNFGKEAALSAGLDHAMGHSIIVIDVDLQDPPELIPEMLRLWQEGFEVVQARRADRSTDRFLKRCTAAAFYRVINALSSNAIPANVGDYRLLDAKVVDALKRYGERERFMKGIFAHVGFRTATIDYERAARYKGETKFSFVSLAQLSIQGITSFSALPLKIWTYIGMLVAASGILYAAYIMARTVLYGIEVPGYASLLVFMLFFNGLTLCGMGIQGEYMARIFSEVKGRPLYIVREKVGDEDESEA